MNSNESYRHIDFKRKSNTLININNIQKAYEQSRMYHLIN